MLFARLMGLSLCCLPLTALATCIGVNCTCSIAANPFSFGNYSPFNATATTATGTVSVTCSALLVGLNVSYVISLNMGSSGTFANRTMKLSSTNLNYNIYTTAADTTVWGDGTSGTGTISDAYILNVLSMTRNYTLFGAIPALQNVGPGTYTDTLTATVTY